MFFLDSFVIILTNELKNIKNSKKIKKINKQV